MKCFCSINGMALAICVMVASACLAEPSVLINGELDEWENGQPVGWNVLAGMAAAQDSRMLVSGSSSARLHPLREQEGPHPNAIIEQMVDLQPNSTYQLNFWAAKDTYGDVRAYVVAQDGSGIVLEYISGWANFMPWTPIDCTFRTNDATHYAVRLVQYGPPADDVWFDRVKLARVLDPGEATHANNNPSEAVTLFSQSLMIPFDPSGPDATALIVDQYSIQKAGNEYEPCLVALQTPRDLTGVNLRLSRDLVSAQGQVISRDDVVIRAEKSGVLPLATPRDVSAGQSTAWWVTVKPTPDLPAGVYQGTLEVVEGDKVIAQADLFVEQLDLSLPQPDASFFVWHSNYYFPPEFLTPELKKSYYQDMADHGMTTVTLYNTPTPDGEQVDFSRNHMLSQERYPEFYKWGFDQSIEAILDAGMCQQGQPLLLLTAAQEGPATDNKYNESMMRGVLDEWATRDHWPTPYFYISDEPSTQERIDKVKPVLERIRSWDFPVTTTTAGLDIPQLGDLYDLWIQAESEISWKNLESAREHGATLWTYNCTVPYTNAPFNRAFYGFWAYRTGLKGFGRWAYHDQRKSVVNDDGTIAGTSGPQLSMVFASSQGPVPTVAWEAAREGIDDYRLMMLFDQTLEQSEHALKNLQAQYQAILSTDDITTLEKLHKRKHTKRSPDDEPIVWQATSPVQRQGEKLFYDAKALERALEVAELAKVKVVESIPADAMAYRAAMPYATANVTLYPPIGPGDARTITETKRRTLISYVNRLQDAMNGAADHE